MGPHSIAAPLSIILAGQDNQTAAHHDSGMPWCKDRGRPRDDAYQPSSDRS